MDGSTRRYPQLSRRSLMRGGAVMAGALGIGAAATAPATAANQAGWRWCNRCQCLFFTGNYTTGWCSQGGGHNYRNSGNYLPVYGSGSGQAGWRWCRVCQGMWYGASASHGFCPSGQGHVSDASGNYIIGYGVPPSGHQPGWRWCWRCYCLAYSYNGSGSCPAGGGHDFSASGSYYLPY